ncbi:MAG: hypothetical protein M1826_005913 [Phylliscum demangeonii]|nr:MAG: hypothetical protein M1826_005913 [Phylliscum demangeonii]
MTKNASKFLNRNVAAHESEDAFARLLLRNPNYQEKYASFYSKLYPVWYGKTLEEAAGAVDDVVDDAFMYDAE